MSKATLNPDTDTEEWNKALDKGQEAAENVGEMASHAGCAVGAMASQAACDASQKADDLAASAGVRIQEMGERFRKSAPQTGTLGSASRAVAQTVQDGGEYLEEAKFTGVIDDIGKLIRSNPVPAICIAIGLGWFMGRKQRT